MFPQALGSGSEWKGPHPFPPREDRAPRWRSLAFQWSRSLLVLSPPFPESQPWKLKMTGAFSTEPKKKQIVPFRPSPRSPSPKVSRVSRHPKPLSVFWGCVPVVSSSYSLLKTPVGAQLSYIRLLGESFSLAP